MRTRWGDGDGDERPVDEEESRRKEKQGSSKSIRVNDKDMMAHPFDGGRLEQRVQSDVGALHAHHGYQRYHLFVTVVFPLCCHLQFSLPCFFFFLLFLFPHQSRDNTGCKNTAPKRIADLYC